MVWLVSPQTKSVPIFISFDIFIKTDKTQPLAQHHYTCYILEWRNHGDSEQTSKPFDFETIAIYDIKAVFDHLCHQLNITHIHAITHSGGGICLTMFLCRYRQFVPYVRSMTLVACQAFLAGERFFPALGYCC